MLNEHPLSNMTDSLRNDLMNGSLGIAAAIQKIKDANESEEFQIQAFHGGNKTFSSAEEIRRHYRDIKEEHREKGMAALDSLLERFRVTQDVVFRLNGDVVTAFQAQLSITGLTESDIRRIANSAQDDYSALRCVAAYGVDHDDKHAKAIGARLADFVEAVEAVPEKTQRFVTKGLNGDTGCADSWHGWIKDRIDAVDTAYTSLQDAVSGRTGLKFEDAFFGFKAAK